jgi:hypothetical protein
VTIEKDRLYKPRISRLTRAPWELVWSPNFC